MKERRFIKKIDAILILTFLLKLYHLYHNSSMEARNEDIEKIKENLKKEFAKRYRTKRGTSLVEIKDKDKESSKQYSVVDVKTMRTRKGADSRLSKSQLYQQQPTIKQTLRMLNFSHHEQKSCLCNNCNCGRHLCRLNVIKPDMKKQSIYQRSFLPKYVKKQDVIVPKQNQFIKTNYLDIGTEYNKNFEGRVKQKPEKPHPKDNLRFQGPIPGITTYGQFHAGHRGQNPYIKPNNQHRRGDYPLLGKSNYTTEFVMKTKIWDFDWNQPDHLKTGSNWYGSTTYNAQFKDHNPEEKYGKSMPINQKEKYSPNPNFSRQFETNYNKEFAKKQAQICPSKIMLETGLSNEYKKSKGIFKENSDFKALSPEFHSISTSKHFYV